MFLLICYVFIVSTPGRMRARAHVHADARAHVHAVTGAYAHVHADARAHVHAVTGAYAHVHADAHAHAHTCIEQKQREMFQRNVLCYLHNLKNNALVIFFC